MRTLLILIPAAAVVVAGFAVRKPEATYDEEELQRLSTDLDARIEAFEAIERPRPPLFKGRVPGEAWDHYAKALSLLYSVEDTLCEYHEDDEAWFRLLEAQVELEIDGTPLPDILRVYHELAEPAILQISLGARAGTCASWNLRTGLDLTVGPFEEDPTFDPTELVSAAQTPILVHAAQLAAQGDFRGAVDTLLVLHRLGEDVARGAPLIQHLMGVTLEGRAVRGLAELLGAGILPDDQVDRVVRLVRAELARRPDRWEMLEGEFLFMEATLRRIAGGERPAELYIGEPGGLPESLLVARNARRAWKDCRDLLPALREAHPAGNVDSVEAAEADLARAKEEHPWLWFPSFELLAEFWRQERARYEAMRLAIALVRFVRREGRVPATVEEFRPASVPASSEAWSYRIEGGRPEIVLAEDEEEDEERPFFRLR
ncbi:MAG: hypothetical protein ACYTDY_14535 [Planctomycetota bacterium]|jgi:hypothetical protein